MSNKICCFIFYCGKNLKLMRINKYNLEAGDYVTLDEKFNNSSNVIIEEVYSENIFARIRHLDDMLGENTWEVMLSRLTPIKL